MRKYLCECCGGTINPKTLQCEYCGVIYSEDGFKIACDDGTEKTLEEIVNTMNTEQKKAMYAIVGLALFEQAEEISRL